MSNLHRQFTALRNAADAAAHRTMTLDEQEDAADELLRMANELYEAARTARRSAAPVRR